MHGEYILIDPAGLSFLYILVLFYGVDMKPILIAGAGPVGCVVALYLAQKGIPIILIEAEKTLPKDLRASTFHPPTLDLSLIHI